MDEVRFRVITLSEVQRRRWRNLTRPTGVPRAVTVWAIAVAASVYAVNHPGRIEITSPENGVPTNASTITVAGTVDSPLLDTITLDVNGSPRPVTVEDGTFRAVVPLIPGRNSIRAFVGGAAVNLVGGSNVLEVAADISPVDIWAELTWAGGGDVDLHLYLPNGEHCYFEQMTTPSGATLDVDNVERDGPEHIVMPTAIPGEYRLMVVYYGAADEPPPAVAWQVRTRFEADELGRTYAGVLRTIGEEQLARTFTFP